MGNARLLTPREAEVLRLLAEGLLNKQIADALGITEGTVEQHLDHVYRKLRVHSRVEAARWYWQNRGATSG